jgi:hypothetical protein
MKTKLLLTSTLSILSLWINAQITITDADVPLGQQTVVTARDTSSFIHPWANGANQTWNFAAFNPINLDTSNAAYANSTTSPYFPAANYGACTTLSFGTICSYINLSSSGLNLVGIEQNFNVGFPIHAVVSETPIEVIYPFPLTYYQTHSQSYTQNQLQSMGAPSPNDSMKYVYHRTRAILVDGWGTLITPYGSYATLRVKEIESNKDSSWVHSASNGWSFAQAHPLTYDTTFVWLANGVFQVASISKYSPTVRRYSFLKSSLVTSIESIALDNTFSIFPNPATTNLYIQSSEKIKSIMCTNYLGQVFELRQTANTIDITALAPGVYFLNITNDKGIVDAKKFVKQ